MNEEQIVVRIAFVLSIIAFFGVIGVGCYAYFDKPESVDLSGVYENKVVIDELLVDMSDVKDDIDSIDTDCNCDIDEEDFEDLEDDVRDVWEDMSKTEYECLMSSLSIECSETSTSGIPHIHDVECNVNIDFNGFKDCFD